MPKNTTKKTHTLNSPNERSSQLAMERLLDLVFFIDVNGVFVQINDSNKKTWGYSSDELIGKTYLDYIIESDRKKTNKAFLNLKSGESIEPFENEFLHKNGSFISLIWSFSWDNEKQLMYCAARLQLQSEAIEINLKSREERFRILSENSSDAVVLINADGSTSYVSPSITNILGYSEEEALNLSLFEILHPDDTQKVSELMEMILNNPGVTFNGQTSRVKHKDGSWKWMAARVTNMLHDPNINGIVDNFRDVTEEVIANEKIKIAEKRFRALEENRADLIVLIDEHAKYHYVSANHESVMGYSEQNLVGKKLFDFIHPSDVHKMKAEFDEIFNHEHIKLSPYRFKHKTKRWCWFQSTVTNLLEEKSVAGILINSVDISDLIHAQNSVKESNERYKLIQKVTNDIIYDWDVENDIFYWGEGFYKIFGFPKNDEPFRLQNWIDLMDPVDAEKEKNRWDKFFKNKKETRWTNTFQMKKFDGNYTYVEEIGNLIRNEKGVPIRMIGVLRDVFHTKRTEKQKHLRNQVANYFNEDNNLSSSLQNSLEYIANYCHFSVAEVYLASNNKRELNLRSSFYLDENALQFQSKSGVLKEVFFEDGYTEEMVHSKETRIWKTEVLHERFGHNSLIDEYGITAFIEMPLFTGENFVGILFLVSALDANRIENGVFYLNQLSLTLGGKIKRKQKEDELHILFDSAPEIIAIASSDGRFTKVNQKFCQLLGYSEQELTSTNFENFIHPDDLNETMDEYSETITGDRKSDNFVNRYRTKDGRICWISWCSSEVFGEDNLVFAFGRDITEIMELQKLLEDAAELARVGSWELDLINETNKSLYFSPMTRKILEIDNSRTISLDECFQMYEDESSKKLKTAMEHLIATGESFDLELLFYNSKGNTQWIRCIGKSERSGGRCLRIYGSFQDINSKKMSELAIKQSNERFKKVTLATNDAIWDWDIVNETFYLGEGYKTLFGYEIENRASTNQSWIEYIHPDDMEMVSTSLNDALNDLKTSNWQSEYRYLKNNGDFAYVIDRGVIIRNHKGKAIRMVGAMSDISYQKEYEKSLMKLNVELQKYSKELEISNSELEQFAFVASHDLQEPLRMITSFLSQLNKNYANKLDERANNYIHFAVDGATRMRQIILDLLSFSKIGKSDEEMEIIRVEKIIEDYSTLRAKLIKEKNATIITNQMPEILTYKIPLIQIFHNLVDNALKYSREEVPTIIEINGERIGAYYEFSVRDNGIGINEEYFNKIFVLFQRLHDNTSYKGTGIGLAIVKKILDNLNGEIRLESQEGVGSIFYIRLPVLGDIN